MEEDKNTKGWKTGRPLVMKWIWKVFIFLIFFILLCILLLQSSTVQTWLVSKLTHYISASTNTIVTAERIKISPFDGLILQNLNILDEKRDTLLHAGAVNVSLRKNIFFLINNQLNLSYIGFRNVNLNITTGFGETKSNLHSFFSNLSSSDKKGGTSRPLDLQLKEVEFGQISIKIDDKNKGKYDLIFLKSGNIDINYVDMVCNDYDINSVLLDSPYFHSYIYQDECLIDQELSIEQNEVTDQQEKEVNNPINFTLRDFAINDGHFGKSNALIPILEKYKDYLDYNNFYFNGINVIVTNIGFRNGILNAKIDGINASDNTGYKINSIKCDSIIISSQAAEFSGLSMEFGQTIVKDRFKLSFADFGAFSEFTDKVILNANLKKSEIYIDDLLHFVRGLDNVSFFRNNKSETVSISGRYFGKINNLGGRDVDISLGNKLSLAGSFNTRDLLDSDNTVLNVRMDRFTSSMRKIKMVLPNFNPPANFYKLGSINFAGRFDGYLEDFVAYGKLKSDVGSVEVDMRLDVTGGQDKANYSGTLDLSNFNLGIWADNKDLGLVNFRSKVAEGKGLTLNTVKAQLDARVNSLIFKKYNYRDFVLDGIIDKNTFNGGFRIEDENIDFVFDGSVEYLNKKAFLNFKSDVKRLDLFA